MAESNRRLLISAAVGLALGPIALVAAPWQVAVLVGWCTAALTFLFLVWRGVRGLDAADTKQLATTEDPGRLVADGVLILGASASLIGVGFVLAKAGESSGWVKGATAGMGALSVALAWTTLQTIFMLRYARMYYDLPAGGIDFNDKAEPDYHDFAYLAFTVGMTYQVSDTPIIDRAVRRVVLRHALLSFLFATAFIAVLVNLVGGLL
jgi:uncharacterized membrane protein